MTAGRGLTAGEAIKTRQFWLLWGVLFFNVTAGIGLLSVASPMIQDLFLHNLSKEAGCGCRGGASSACSVCST